MNDNYRSEPLDTFADDCNKRCNELWKISADLSNHIKTLPEGQTKEYLLQLKSIYGLMGELFFFNAVSLGTIRGMQEGVIKVLYKEVFGNKQITLPYNPQNHESLQDIIKRYKEKEPVIDWNVRDLKDKAKDLEEPK